uniref:hypothetical protein n=1 Tax=Proteus mirabilis TaxID=584 RepID=UPI0015C547AE
EGLAEEWWDLQKSELDVPNLTWDEFEEIFCRTYVPLSFRQSMIREFDKLEQGEMTVVQYHARFIKLSRFNPGAVADPIV